MTRITCIGLLLAVVAGAGASVDGGRPQAPTATTRTTPPPPPRTIVIAELFTSEGCSSCPPADALLRRLVADQPLDGIDVVALGNHVDYWDRLGWRDPFSSAIFSQRQSRYSAQVFRSDSIYTPQVVVDGTLESVGSDEASVRKNIIRAAREPKAVVDVSALPEADGSVRVHVRVQVPDRVRRTGPADLVVAVTEDGLVTQVQRGENGGRTLAHSAVVRLLETVALVDARDHAASGTLVVKLEKAWRPERLRVVALLQEQTSRRIVGAGATRLAARPPRG